MEGEDAQKKSAIVNGVCGAICSLIFALVIQFIIFPNDGKDEVFCNMKDPVTHVEWFEGYLIAYYISVGLNLVAGILAIAGLLSVIGLVKAANGLLGLF